jgi:hypothetical protein
MATYLNDFVSRNQIKERCKITIARTDCKNDLTYNGIVTKLENCLHNIFILVENVN